MKSVKRMGVLKLFSTLSIKLFSIVALIVAAKYLTAEDLGIFAYSISYVTMFMVVGNLGFGEYYLKISAEGSNKSQANGAFAFLSLLSLLLINTLVLLSLYFNSHTSHKNLILFSLLIINFEFLNKTMRYFLTSQYKVAISSFGRVIGRFVQSSSKVIFMFIFSSLIFLYISNIIGLSLIFFIYAFFLRKETFSPPPKKVLLAFFSFSIPLYFVKMINAFFDRGLPLFIFIFYGEIVSGLYYISSSITQPLYLFSSSISAVMLVSLSKKMHENDFLEIDKFIDNFEKIINILILPLVMIFIILKSEIVNYLFGENYSEAQYLIPFLVVSFYFSSITVPYSNILLISSKFKILLYSQFVCLTIFMSLFYLLENKFISFYGIESNFDIIGFSILIYYLSRSLITRFFVFKYYSIILSRSNICKLVIFFFSLYLSDRFYSLLNLRHMDILLLISIIILTSFTLYFGLLKLFGQLKKDDIDLILSAVNINKFKKEIREEIRFD